jgi:hypothetical protein
MRVSVVPLFFVLGCVDAVVVVPPPKRPIESFWLAQAMGEAQRPPPPRYGLQSISLGYVGDSPLTGGVMLDTPDAEEEQPPDDEDTEVTPEVWSRHGTIRIGTRRRRRR